MLRGDPDPSQSGCALHLSTLWARLRAKYDRERDALRAPGTIGCEAADSPEAAYRGAGLAPGLLWRWNVPQPERDVSGPHCLFDDR